MGCVSTPFLFLHSFLLSHESTHNDVGLIIADAAFITVSKHACSVLCFLWLRIFRNYLARYFTPHNKGIFQINSTKDLNPYICIIGLISWSWGCYYEILRLSRQCLYSPVFTNVLISACINQSFCQTLGVESPCRMVSTLKLK